LRLKRLEAGLQVAEAVGTHEADDELVLAAARIDGDAAGGYHGHAVLGLKCQP